VESRAVSRRKITSTRNLSLTLQDAEEENESEKLSDNDVIEEGSTSDEDELALSEDDEYQEFAFLNQDI